MTALELTIYPRQPRTPGPGTGWADWRRDQDHEGKMAHDKRFTDAELAAESYRQMVRAVAVAGIATLDNGEIVPADVLGPSADLSPETRCLGVIKRFATHPHYYEETE